MKKFYSILSIALCLYGSAYSQGGMWPVNSLHQRADDMQKSGLKIPVSEVYNSEKPAYNDAVVLFGGGCTGELVSGEGLLFTNHHCGYSFGQSLSTVDRNILIDGFWAMNNGEELPCPGLEVKIVKSSMDISSTILTGVTEQMSESERNKIIKKNIDHYTKAHLKIDKVPVEVKAYYDGNMYVAHVMETFKDVRLVGFPPNGIGKFGGDTDNWMWPRHTGDFAVFRVYAGKNNQPAEYSADNKPYKPKKYFPISTKGVQEGDFSMVYGFPFRTTQYISSYQVELIQEIIDPIRINARSAKLAVWDKTMRADAGVFLKYASKQSSISNGWKKWQGEIRGLELNDVIGKKQEMEIKFQKIVDGSYPEYKSTLAEIQALIAANKSIVAGSEIIRETVLGIEIINAAQYINRMIKALENDTISSSQFEKEYASIEKSLENYFKNYDIKTDMLTFDTLMPIYFRAKEYDALPVSMEKLYINNAADFKIWRDVVFNQSALANFGKIQNLLKQGKSIDIEILKNDPAFQIFSTILNYRNEIINPRLDSYQSKLDQLNRKFTAGQLKTNVHEKQLYPDANQSLRVTYGPVKGIQPYGSSEYSYLTTLDQVIEKTNPNIDEFNTPSKLIQLYRDKDYGRWASNGTVPVCFVAQNHTSGGNSGSPVLNAKGELIGINFDRIWDGTMSDIYYDPNLCRNISVDIRYVMFIIEKFGNAGWLFKEMNIK